MTRDQHRSDAGAWPWPAPVAPLALDPWQYAGPYDPERSGLEPLQLRQQDGKALRKLVPYGAHGAWKPPADRPDPVRVLMKTNEGRQQAPSQGSDTRPAARGVGLPSTSAYPDRFAKGRKRRAQAPMPPCDAIQRPGLPTRIHEEPSS